MRIVFVRLGKFCNSWRLLSFPSRTFCTKNTNKTTSSASQSEDGALVKHDDAYRQLDNLDFATAAKILFADPPKKKKFGFDFHLVQLFFACMPSLAVYLVAQYARYEMRKMEKELEEKKQAEEENKAKEAEVEEKAKKVESDAIERKTAGSDADLLEVKVRLNKLEETIKEIVVESKKQSDSSIKNEHDQVNETKSTPNVIPNTQHKSESREDPPNKGSKDIARAGYGKDKINGSVPNNVSQEDSRGKS